MRARLISSYYFFTAFLAGTAVMALEIVGFRLFAPYFGYSVYVWGSLLGVIMAALAIGYYLGGRLADRHGHPALLYIAVFVAGGYIILIYHILPILVRPLLAWDLIVSSLIVSGVVYGVPMCCLSMVSPFIIGVMARTGAVGTTAGRIYGLSTIGSLVGTFAAAFYLLPTYGTRVTLLICFFTLAMLALGGLLLHSRRAAWLIGLAPLALFPSEDRLVHLLAQGRTVLADTESQYARILVLDDPRFNTISLQSHLASTHSAFVKGRLLSGRSWFWDFFSLGPMLAPHVERYLVLGVAGGVTLRQLRYFFPHLYLDGVEIDPKMLEIARRHFGLVEDDRMTLHIADARPFLRQPGRPYDVIGIDLFGGELYIPFYVASREFYQAVRDRLTADGALLMNTSGPTQEILNTVAAVFPSVFVIEGYPILIAFRTPTTLEAVKDRLRAFPLAQLETQLRTAQRGEPPLEQEMATLEGLQITAWEKLRPIAFDPKMAVFTDDHAPIERLAYLGTWKQWEQGRKHH